jgi:SAM-dependent methyltransferase
MNTQPPVTDERKVEGFLPLLRCPACSSLLRAMASEGQAIEALQCTNCSRQVPVRDGIPRFVAVPEDDLARRTQASFGYEWTHFSDWTASGEKNFQDYFAGLDLHALQAAHVLDAGCGMGRHARLLAPHAARLVAADFSRAIETAAANLAGQPNVLCIQADLTSLPVADEAFDFVYSMGVVHHLSNTEEAVRALARKLRSGGRLRLYLYWKREGLSRYLLGLVSVMRHVTTRLPFPLLRAFCWVLSAGLYGAVVLPYRLLSRLGATRHQRWPLFVYTKYPFAVLYNDQFDRFSAPLEKRYSAAEARALMESAGLRDVRVEPRYGWLVDGTRPGDIGIPPNGSIE